MGSASGYRGRIRPIVHTPQDDLLVGQTFSHYRIGEKLGVGGMGVVYKAEDARLHRHVALKFVSAELTGDADALSRFQREARSASALNHPHICTSTTSASRTDDRSSPWSILEGATLRDRLDAGPLGASAAIDIGVQIADALEAAHAAGIVHRDIKPANIFVGSRGHVKVLDFGIAKMRDVDAAQADVTTVTATRHGAVIGTAALHGAGAGARRAGRSSRRHLESRPGALRNDHGDAAPPRTCRCRSTANPSWSASSRSASRAIALFGISTLAICGSISSA